MPEKRDDRGAIEERERARTAEKHEINAFMLWTQNYDQSNGLAFEIPVIPRK